MSIKGESTVLGYADDPIEGHKIWLKEKRRLANLLSLEFSDQRLSEALIKRYENYKIIWNGNVYINGEIQYAYPTPYLLKQGISMRKLKEK